MALNESGSLGFSKKLKMSRMDETSEHGNRNLHGSAAGERAGDQGERAARPEQEPRSHSSSSAAVASGREPVSTSSTLRHSDCSSLMRTLKLSGSPASRV